MRNCGHRRYGFPIIVRLATSSVANARSRSPQSSINSTSTIRCSGAISDHVGPSTSGTSCAWFTVRFSPHWLIFTSSEFAARNLTRRSAGRATRTAEFGCHRSHRSHRSWTCSVRLITPPRDDGRATCRVAARAWFGCARVVARRRGAPFRGSIRAGRAKAS